MIFAISAKAAATPPKPKIAAITASTNKITIHLNIVNKEVWLKNCTYLVKNVC